MLYASHKNNCCICARIENNTFHKIELFEPHQLWVPFLHISSHKQRKFSYIYPTKFRFAYLIIPHPYPIRHKIIGHDRYHAPTLYHTKLLSICCFCPLKSFCFSYKSFRSLQSSFMRSNRSRTPALHSGSIFLYSPVR